MDLDPNGNSKTGSGLEPKPVNKADCSPLFLWTSAAIILTALATGYITDPFRSDRLAFRDSLIGCFGAHHQLCEPLNGNPIGTSEVGSSANVWSYDDVKRPMGGVHLKFHDASYYVGVDDNGAVDSVIYDGIEYFYDSGKVYVKPIRSPYEDATLLKTGI